MRKLIEEMQKMIKEEKIRFNGVIELEQDESEKGKLSKREPIEVKRSK